LFCFVENKEKKSKKKEQKKKKPRGITQHPLRFKVVQQKKSDTSTSNFDFDDSLHVVLISSSLPYIFHDSHRLIQEQQTRNKKRCKRGQQSFTDGLRKKKQSMWEGVQHCPFISANAVSIHGWPLQFEES
jgi:hypothetical protein